MLPFIEFAMIHISKKKVDRDCSLSTFFFPILYNVSARPLCAGRHYR